MDESTRPAFPVLQGTRVMLAELTEDHLEAVRRWRGDPEVTRYWITREIPSMADLQEWLDENRLAGSLTWLISDETGAPIGYTNVFGINREHRHCEFALMIGERDRWGQGYASEALGVLLPHLFAPIRSGGLGMHKVSLAVFAENRAARRAYAKSGFKEDGVLREDMFYDGHWYDQVLMSLLAREFWQSQSSAVDQ